jgi:hypothetical protein
MGAWKAVLTAKAAQGMLGGQELKEALDKAASRTEKLKGWLRGRADEERGPGEPQG